MRSVPKAVFILLFCGAVTRVMAGGIERYLAVMDEFSAASCEITKLDLRARHAAPGTKERDALETQLERRIAELQAKGSFDLGRKLKEIGTEMTTEEKARFQKHALDLGERCRAEIPDNLKIETGVQVPSMVIPEVPLRVERVPSAGAQTAPAQVK